MKNIVYYYPKTNYFYLVELSEEEFKLENRNDYIETKIDDEEALRMFPHPSNDVRNAEALADEYTNRFNIQNEEAKQTAINKTYFICDYAKTLYDAIAATKGKGLSEALKVDDYDIYTSVAEGM